MKRRDFIALLGFLSLGGAAVMWRQLASLWRPDPKEHIERIAAALSDLMFPGDGLPAASELGLHKTVATTTDLAAPLTKTAEWLDRRAVHQGAADFLALDEAGRVAAVDAAFASDDGDLRQFILTLRYRLGTAYYSQPAIKAAFAYTGPPQPDGFADFEDRPA